MVFELKIWYKIELFGSLLIILFGGIYEMFYSNEIGHVYIPGALVIGLIWLMFSLIIFYEGRKDEKSIKTPVNEFVHVFTDYKFLLRQLVGRDFSVKYRRSYLGFLWTIINPLLTMIVMSAVFAYIFKISTQNYALYLIIGNVTFNCFSEATQLALLSIVGSGQLIKKVYMPKYIFPLSKAMFSFINYLISLIPVGMVMIYYKVAITKYIVLIPVVAFFLFLFAVGIGLVLATFQVTMRDTQYLYGIVLVLWTYLTPIFYTFESISPSLQKIIAFNPMYIYINCMREILVYNSFPRPYEMAGGLLYGVVLFTIGIYYFYRHQKKFILHI